VTFTNIYSDIYVDSMTLTGMWKGQSNICFDKVTCSHLDTFYTGWHYKNVVLFMRTKCTLCQNQSIINQ